MKSRFLLLAILSLGILLSIAYDNYYPKWAVIGTYVYNFPRGVIAEGPNSGDRLILEKEGYFRSTTWGKGTYELKGVRLLLSSNEGGHSAYFYRELFWGKPRIVVERDLNYYFEKLD